MMLDSVFKFTCPFEVWVPVTTSAGTVDYVQIEANGRAMLVAAPGGLALVSKEQIPLESAIRRLKDVHGNLLHVANGEPYDVFVTSVEPQFNAFGEVRAWRHPIRRRMSVKVTTTQNG